MIIGWPTNVNKVILDSTSVTVGDGAVVTDSMEVSGVKKRRLGCANPADKYQVVMEFDFAQKDTNGFTELERFYKWYKWTHKYGLNPFEFPAILVNSNRKEGFSTEEITYGNVPDTEKYVITSAIEGTKSGLSQQIKMTWETYATGKITITENIVAVNNLSAVNGCVSVIYTDTPAAEPVSTDFSSMTIDNALITVQGVVFDGDKTANVYFTPLTATGSHTVAYADKTATFSVQE